MAPKRKASSAQSPRRSKRLAVQAAKKAAVKTDKPVETKLLDLPNELLNKIAVFVYSDSDTIPVLDSDEEDDQLDNYPVGLNTELVNLNHPRLQSCAHRALVVDIPWCCIKRYPRSGNPANEAYFDQSLDFLPEGQLELVPKAMRWRIRPAITLTFGSPTSRPTHCQTRWKRGLKFEDWVPLILRNFTKLIDALNLYPLLWFDINLDPSPKHAAEQRHFLEFLKAMMHSRAAISIHGSADRVPSEFRLKVRTALKDSRTHPDPWRDYASGLCTWARSALSAGDDANVTTFCTTNCPHPDDEEEGAGHVTYSNQRIEPGDDHVASICYLQLHLCAIQAKRNLTLQRAKRGGLTKHELIAPWGDDFVHDCEWNTSPAMTVEEQYADLMLKAEYQLILAYFECVQRHEGDPNGMKSWQACWTLENDYKAWKHPDPVEDRVDGSIEERRDELAHLLKAEYFLYLITRISPTVLSTRYLAFVQKRLRRNKRKRTMNVYYSEAIDRINRTLRFSGEKRPVGFWHEILINRGMTLADLTPSTQHRSKYCDVNQMLECFKHRRNLFQCMDVTWKTDLSTKKRQRRVLRRLKARYDFDYQSFDDTDSDEGEKELSTDNEDRDDDSDDSEDDDENNEELMDWELKEPVEYEQREQDAAKEEEEEEEMEKGQGGGDNNASSGNNTKRAKRGGAKTRGRKSTM